MSGTDAGGSSTHDGTVLQTTYRNHGAGDLLDYISRDSATLRDSAGMEMTDTQKQNFIEKSEQHGFERDLIIAPDPDDGVTPGEVARGTMKAMRQFAKGRPTVAWCFAVHTDTEKPHAHVALTGERDDLYLDRGDIQQERQRVHEAIRDAPSYQHRQEREQAQERLQERQQEQATDRDRGVGR